MSRKANKNGDIKRKGKETGCPGTSGRRTRMTGCRRPLQPVDSPGSATTSEGHIT